MSGDMLAHAHLDAIEAQLRLAVAQVEMLRHHLTAPVVTHEPDVPARCQGVPESLCARQCDDARIDVGGMGGAAARWICRGCGEEV
jgi:hypothetical protein